MDRPQPLVDDWMGQWDYEAVLSKYEVDVAKLEGFEGDPTSYQLGWCKGFMHIPTSNEEHARRAAALFVELWLRGFAASFADKLMDGYLFVLEREDDVRRNTS